MHVHRGVRYIYYCTLSAVHNARKRASGPGDDKPRFYSTHPFQETFMFFSVKLVYYFSDSHFTKKNLLFYILFTIFPCKRTLSKFLFESFSLLISLLFIFSFFLPVDQESDRNYLKSLGICNAWDVMSRRCGGSPGLTGKIFRGRARNENKWKEGGK